MQCLHSDKKHVQSAICLSGGSTLSFTTRLFSSLFALLILSSTQFVFGQNNSSDSSPETLRVFFDCTFFCDTQYITQELPILDFVTERTQADVHVMYASQSTGSGGSLVTLTFFGQRTFAALSDTLQYATGSNDSNDEQRQTLLHNLTIGLSRYLAHAGMADRLVVRAKQQPIEAQENRTPESDPWNAWVFSIGGNGSLDGQSSSKFTRKSANLSANRTTEALKVRISGNVRESTSEFDTGTELIKSSTNSERFSAQVVHSIGGQWALGGNASVSSSSFANAKSQLEIGPSIEYNFFPYTQSTRKLLTAQYKVTLGKRNYDELTIFGLGEETILQHSLDLSLSLSQKWGSVSVSTDVNHMITNFDRSLTDSYNMGVFGSANIRLFRGLSLNAFASYNRIRDQIDLPGNAATKEEILLQSIQLPTGYSYGFDFGLTYRFGSIFNNVVNPRMGGGGGGGGQMIIMM